MNKLALMILTATLTSQAAGCIIHDEYNGGGGGGGGGGFDVATISARWSLRNMLDGATTACPQGYDTVQLIAQAIDVDGYPVGEPNIDLFDCGARSGSSTDLPPDVYQVWLEVRTHDLVGLYAQSLSQVLDVRTADEAFQTDILNDGGFFQLSWDLIGNSSGRPLLCADVVGLDAVKLVSASVADATRVYEDTRACEDHSAVTDGLLQGTYTVQIDALDTANRSRGRVTTLTNKRINGHNQVTDLGHMVIPIDGM